MISAKCHCGNVRLEIAALPASVTSCNCSICHRIGALWAYYVPTDVRVSCEFRPTSTYSWGDRMLAFHTCPRCGCTTHYTHTSKTARERIAVNARMIDRRDMATVPVRYFDGADTWEFVDGPGA